ncbi:ABC transporter permease [Pueribacillus sp. YX66]|uniref:ABC transporter permease n=1 Tax=Pueribacillus sp. YX66 TaxID=3229242 RepID=UPI00358D4644
MSKFWTVLFHTYLSRLKTKSFIISTIVTLLFVLAFLNIDKIFALFEDNEVKQVAVIDESGRLFELLLAQIEQSSEEIELQAFEGDEQAAEQAIQDGDVEGALTLSMNDKGLPEGVLKANTVTEERWIGPLEQALQQVKVMLATQQLDLSPEEVSTIYEPVAFERVAIEEGAKTEEEVAQATFIVNFLTILIYMAVLIYGMMIVTDVAQEKSSRVMEILISSVSPVIQMFGKIVGIALLGITQIVLIFVVGFLSIRSNANNEGSIVDALQLEQLPISIILYAIVFFILGFLLYATMLAMLGSLVSRVEDANQVVTPVVFLIIAAFFMATFGMNAPDSTFITVMSYIPFFSPMLMLMRIGMLNIPMWEIVLSLIILIASIGLFAVIGARIYRGGVLMYGKSSFKDIKKALALSKK